MIKNTVTNFNKLPQEMQDAIKHEELRLLLITRALAYHEPHSETARKATATLQEYTQNG